MAKPVSFSENALRILKARYFMKNENGELIEKNPEQLFRRVAKYIAKAEKDEKLRKFWEKKFYEIMINKDFMPNSPTLTGAGRDMCLSACFVLPIEDSLASIFETVRNAALVHKEGGGTGFDFSRLRPKGSFVRKTQGIASGPISFLKVIDAATEAVKQGGCVAPETRVSTGKGLVKIKSLGSKDKPGWHPLKIKVMTDEGEKETDEFYNNGVSPVKTVITECGYHITATFDHRIRGIDDNGNYVWKKMEELKEGDWTVLQKNTYFENEFYFPEFNQQPHFNSKKIKIPKKLNHNLSELFGYFIGDGCFNRGRLILSISHSQMDLKEHYENIMKKEFGIDGRIEQKQNDKSIKLIFQSNLLEKWFDLIGVKKENALNARIPELIFKTTKENAASFLRGLFDADGTISKEGHVEISSVSEGLIDDVQLLLLSLGIPSKNKCQSYRKDSFGKNPIWRLRIITLEGYRKFKELIGFTSKVKKERLENINLKPWEFNDIIPNQRYLVAALYRYTGRGCSAGRTSRGADRNLYRDIQQYLPQISVQINLTRARLAYLFEKYPQTKESKLFLLFNKNQFYDRVKTIKEGKSLTLDLSVPGNHTYIANGFVSHNTRRGANMGILRVDHPDIEEFITMKQDGKTLTNFNISVAITDKFMEALKNNGEYEIVNPHTGKVTEKKSAKKMFDMIVESAWMIGDPGLVFIDRINQLNSTRELGEIRATNPCGEQPLHDYESCNLGSINLANFWDESKNEFQWERFEEVINTSVRFLDNVINVNKYPLPQIEHMTKMNRRIGLGVMGFADLLIKMKIKYDTEEAIEVAEKIASFLLKKSLKASEKLAEEKGSFPNIDKSIYKGKKMRNATTITIAPTGTISRIAGCSSSIEPIYAFEMVSKIIDSEIKDLHPLYEKWKDENPEKPLPDYFITAHEISPEWHVRMQAAFQRFANNATSKTINFPNSATKEDVEKAYILAYNLGVKGVTIYRDGSRTEQVLYKEAPPEEKKLAPMERPDSLYSVTDKIKTGFGNLYITISYFMGKPFEVFASIGKSGYSTMADAEALGRLTSLCLRSGIEPKEIINQLKGIGGSEPIFHNGHLVQSIPDAIAQVLERHIGKVEGQRRKDLNVLKCPICGASLPDEKCPICINCGWTRCT